MSTNRDKARVQLKKIKKFLGKNTISDFLNVSKDPPRVRDQSIKQLSENVFIPLSLITDRISTENQIHGRLSTTRGSVVYETIREELRALFDAETTIFNDETGEDVLLKFFIQNLISGSAERITREREERRKAEKEAKKKKRTEEIAKKKKKTEETIKEEKKESENALLLQQDSLNAVRQEAEAKAEELQALQREQLIVDLDGGSSSESGSSSETLSEFEELSDEPKETKKIKIKIKKGAEKSLNDVSKRDKKQDEIDVKDGGLSQVPSEQPITQAQEDADLQENQLQENVNPAAEALTGVALELQDIQNEAEQAQPQEVEPVDDIQETENVIIDFFQNESNLTAERLAGEGVPEEKELSRFQEFLADLDNYINTAKILRGKINNGIDTESTLNELIQIRRDIYGDREPEHKTLLRMANELTDDEEERKEVKVLINTLNSILSLQRGGELENRIRNAETRAITRQLEQKEVETRRFLEKTQLAIDTIKEQLDEDGLVYDRGVDFPDSPNARLARQAVVEMTEEVEEKGDASFALLERFSVLFKVLKRDTQGVVLQVLQNAFLEGEFGSIGNKIISGLLIRFLGRLLYAGKGNDETDDEKAIEGFVDSGYTLEGRNNRVVGTLLSMLRQIVPEPPPFEPVRMERQVTPEAEEQILRRRGTREVEIKIEEEFKDVAPPQSSIFGRFKGLFEKKPVERVVETQPSGVVVDIGEPTEEEKEVLQEIEDDINAMAQAAALAAIANPDVEAGVSGFDANFADMIKASIESNPAEPGVIRQAIAKTPGFLKNLAGGIADTAARIFVRNPRIRERIPRGELLGALAAGLLVVLVKQFMPEGEEIPQRTAETQRQGQGTTEASRGQTTEFKGGEEQPVPEEDIDKPQGEPLLRPDFFMLGTEYFDKLYNVPQQVQNSEWSQFDFVPKVDRQNNIELDNILGDGIRYGGQMYYPKYQAPVAPPSRKAILRTRDTLAPAIQLSQGYAPKFQGAISLYDNLSYTYDHDPFSRSWEDEILYHPDNSTL